MNTEARDIRYQNELNGAHQLIKHSGSGNEACPLAPAVPFCLYSSDYRSSRGEVECFLSRDVVRPEVGPPISEGYNRHDITAGPWAQSCSL
jgi:hypothetical protein